MVERQHLERGLHALEMLMSVQPFDRIVGGRWARSKFGQCQRRDGKTSPEVVA
jgi:hypothetical protein